jgi:hypothetical protein
MHTQSHTIMYIICREREVFPKSAEREGGGGGGGGLVFFEDSVSAYYIYNINQNRMPRIVLITSVYLVYT